MRTHQEKVLQLPFRPRARLMQLLGDELIASPRLAVFELVKNAYDACAKDVRVQLLELDSEDPWIEVRDDGDGMDIDTIRSVWLVPGHDHRKQARQRGESSQCGRLPLGEKGVGRFAAHKLGDQILLVTRAAGEPECVVDIDWLSFTEGVKFLSDVPVKVTTREPEVFRGEATGTLIRIGRLRPPEWTRGEVRRLHRQITSICSPFHSPESFSTALEVPGFEHWIADIPHVGELLDRAFWHFRFSFDGHTYAWRYEFRPAGLSKIEGRVVEETTDLLLVPEDLDVDAGTGRTRRQREKQASREFILGIGRIEGEFHVYDRDRDVKALLPETQLLDEYLDQQGGIRIYRDGIRVYNYGEPGDDWLGLDLRRVNKPTRKLSRNLIIGALHLTLESSPALIEKTNREGFVENEAFRRLKRLVLGVLATLERERLPDKERIRKHLAKDKSQDHFGIHGPLSDLKQELAGSRLYERCKPHLAKLEQRYEEMQENLLRPAISSLNLSLLFHEVERGVRELLNAVKTRQSPEQLERQARDMAQLLGDFSTLLRRHEKKRHPMGQVVDQARRINAIRFKVHRVALDCDVSMEENPGFEAVFPFGLVLGALNNLIDNSIYWLGVRWPNLDDSEIWESSPRRICITTSRDIEKEPVLVVADTGSGFRDMPENLVRPFYTRKPEGMGLGLYYVNLVMELCGGRLIFPQAGDVQLPKNFDGAVVALQFPEVK